MIAGRMNVRLAAYKPVYTTDAYGSETVTYASVGYIRAERVKYTGAASEEVSEHFADYKADFNVRRAHAIGETWRVRGDRDDKSLYQVKNVLYNHARGYKTLQCERVNE